MYRRLDNFLLFIRSFFKCWRKHRLRGREGDSQFVDFLSIRCGSILRLIFRQSGCLREAKATASKPKKKHSFRSGLVLDRGLENCFIMFHSRFLCIAILSILRFIMYTKHTSSTLYTLVTDSDIYRLHHRVFVPASPRLILLINILSCFALSPLRRRRLRFHLHFPLFQLIIADVVIARDCVSMQVR